MTARTHRITVIPGDGVGPEVVRSAVRIIDAAGVSVDWEYAEAGAEVFKRGDTSGVPAETRASIERTRVALKGPLETPVGFGEKSANVTLRKLFETYANVRPARELPGVKIKFGRLEDFADAILQHRPPQFSLAETLRNAETLDRLLVASR